MLLNLEHSLTEQYVRAVKSIFIATYSRKELIEGGVTLKYGLSEAVPSPLGEGVEITLVHGVVTHTATLTPSQLMDILKQPTTPYDERFVEYMGRLVKNEAAQLNLTEVEYLTKLYHIKSLIENSTSPDTQTKVQRLLARGLTMTNIAANYMVYKKTA